MKINGAMLLKTKIYLPSILLLFSFAFIAPRTLAAVTLYFQPSEGEYKFGESFGVDIKIDTGGECINAVETTILFPKEAIRAEDFSKGESILLLWAQEPTISNEKGTIHFAGGIPGGYCGKIQGDPGPSDILGKIILRVPGFSVGKKIDSAKIEFSSDSQVLLNDGFGTPAKLELKSAEFRIVEGSPSKNEWVELLRSDNIPPEPFLITLHSNPTMFDGKFYAVFSTTDKQTGIDRYEAQELDLETYFSGEDKNIKWRPAAAPYVLEDQTLKSVLRIKAVDKAGNERVVEYVPRYIAFKRKPATWLTKIIMIIKAIPFIQLMIVALLWIMGILAIYFIISGKKQRN